MYMIKAMDCIARVVQTFGNVDKPDDALRDAQRSLGGFTNLLSEVTPDCLDLAEAVLSIGCPLTSNAQ
jgi:hypothetical protein